MPLSAPAACLLPSLQLVLETEHFILYTAWQPPACHSSSLQACLEPLPCQHQHSALCTWPSCQFRPLQARLADDLRRLTPDQFEWALSIVTVRYPGLPTGPGELLEFDISKLDSLTLRQLIDFVAACQAHAKVRGGLLNMSANLCQGSLLVCAVCYLPASRQRLDKGFLAHATGSVGSDGCEPQHYQARRPGSITRVGQRLRRLPCGVQACCSHIDSSQSAGSLLVWPCNPVGVGSRNLKPRARKRQKATSAAEPGNLGEQGQAGEGGAQQQQQQGVSCAGGSGSESPATGRWEVPQSPAAAAQVQAGSPQMPSAAGAGEAAADLHGREGGSSPAGEPQGAGGSLWGAASREGCQPGRLLLKPPLPPAAGASQHRLAQMSRPGSAEAAPSSIVGGGPSDSFLGLPYSASV